MNYEKNFLVPGILIAIVLVLAAGFIGYHIGKNAGTVASATTNAANQPAVSGGQNMQSATTTSAVSGTQNTTASACKKTSPPSLVLLTPAGGETFHLRQGISIKWTTCNIPSNIIFNSAILEHYPHDSSFVDIASISNTYAKSGSVTWTLPGTLDTSREYSVYLQTGLWSVAGKQYSLTAESKPFSIVP